jgi:signal transduction histidine kinase
MDAFYRSIFLMNDWAVYVIRIERDGTFWFEDANQRAATIARRPIEELRNKPVHEALPPVIAECLGNSLERCAADRNMLTYLRGLDLPEGRASWKTTLVPVEDDYGDLCHIVGITRDITFEEALFNQAEQSRAILDGLGIAVPSAVYLRNLKTTTIRFLGGDADTKRLAWRKKAEEAGPLAGELFTHPADLPIREEQFRKLAELPDGAVLVTHIRVMGPDGDFRKISCRETVFSRDQEGQVEQILGASDDITEYEHLQEERRDLAERMVTLQMDERRRLAEELHDSTAQHLTGASLALTRILAAQADGTGAESFFSTAIGDALRSLEEAEREIRVLSYLFHPPLLDDIGFVSAIKTFSTGFAKRTGLELDLHVDDAAAAVDPETAHNLMRVCQEGLANVHRHASSTKVEVRVDTTPSAITLQIVDHGVGIHDQNTENFHRGIGLAGMRERMQRLNGSLSVRDWGEGTELVATVPIKA